MSSITTSFHSSSRKHAIKNASDLSRIQSHNDRGYFHWEYDKSKIHNIIGDSHTISADTKKYINKKFKAEIEKYNAKQKQKCRRIEETPFDYFCKNKKLDIANEVIFQVGDKNFWEKYREEKKITRNNKTYILKSYPENVKKVMDDIFKKQAEAYENIYQTHKDLILNKIITAYNESSEYLNSIDLYERSYFLRVVDAKKEKRDEMISFMNEDKRERYATFFDAYETVLSIEKKKLIEHTRDDQMEIKLNTLTGHYDEWSPHAHGISVCSVRGYKTGLDCRVAKSVVLNRYALEVIQDRMHEIAKEEMAKHPEIFEETKLADKKKGRNFDYTTEQWIHMKQEELVKEVTELSLEIKGLKEDKEKLDKKIEEAEEETRKAKENAEKQIEKIQKEADEKIKAAEAETAKYVQAMKENEQKLIRDAIKKVEDTQKLVDEKKAEAEKWDKILGSIGDEQDYINEADSAYGIAEYLCDLSEQLVEREEEERDKTLEQKIRDAFMAFYDALTRALKRLRMYEVREEIPEEERRSTPLVEAKLALDEKISSGRERTSATTTNPKQEKGIQI